MRAVHNGWKAPARVALIGWLRYDAGDLEHSCVGVTSEKRIVFVAINASCPV